MSEPESQGKSYDIPKRLVWDAWLKVKENGGAAGADGVTIGQYEQCRLIKVPDSGFPHIHRWARPGSVDKAVMVARAARLP